MATIIDLPNGLRVLDYNWITGHVKVFLVANTYGEFNYIFYKPECVAPNNIRFTLCRGTQSYVIPLTQTTSWPTLLPSGTFTNRKVEYGISDAGTLRTLRIKVTRLTSPADDIWDGKCRVMMPMNGITDTDITEQLNRSNVESVDVIQ